MQPTESVISPPLPLKEVTTLLIKHFGYHEGLFEIAFSIQIAVGQVGPTPETQSPGAAFGITGIGLAKAERVGPNTVDAAKVNPLKADTKPAAAPARKPRAAKSR